MAGDDTLLTATEASKLIPSVSPHLIYVWRGQGKLQSRGKRGRSPLYRWADVVAVERATRSSGYSHRAA